MNKARNKECWKSRI